MDREAEQKASVLAVQRSRMKRALSYAMDPSDDEEESQNGTGLRRKPALPADIDGDVSPLHEGERWSDPSDWDEATQKQWKRFMHGSQAEQVSAVPLLHALCCVHFAI